ncbi:MAG: ATP-binding cassette domain-containing protein [Candidatus Lernaella stagnicola]|nr:ATP-binding cassette domain-containing protein [Candidatus Lernaella stagnicola]
MAKGDTLIRFEHVEKSFGPKVIYDDLTIDVKEGENLVIIGGSGTGKSVLLKILIGLLTPEAGHVWFGDREITAMGEDELIKVRADIAYVFQQAALFDSMTVADNIAYPLRAHLNLTHDELWDKVQLNLDRVGLPGSAHLMPSELSGGMRKRIGLARAIALEPRVILWDEPTTGLDPSNTRRISELILKMQEDLSVTSLVVTHDMSSAMLVADRIALLHDLRIHQVIAKADIKNEPEGSLIRDFIEGNLDL